MFFIGVRIKHISIDKENIFINKSQEVKNMTGEKITGEKITEQNEDMRVLITYKGSAEIGKEFQDDYMILELVTDGRPDALASAVINFPLLDGNKSIFIHDLVSYESMEAKESLLEVIEKFARKRGYAAIYINSIRQDRGFLDKEKFMEVSGKTMAKRDVSR